MNYRNGTAAQANNGTVVIAAHSSTVVGDQLLLFVSRGANETIPTPAGWTALATRSATSLTVTVFSRVAAVAGAGTAVSFALTSSGKWIAHLESWQDTGAVEAVTTSAVTTSAATVVTPIVTTGVNDRFLVEHVVTKTSTPVTDWAPPAGRVNPPRLETYQTGSGAVAAATSDDGPEAAGALGGGTWTADQTTTQRIAVSLALPPAAPAATVADAGPDQTVDAGQVVTLDYSGSSPGGGTYATAQLSGTSVTVTGGTTVAPTFPAPSLTVAEDLVFQLTYTANSVADTDTVTIGVNASAPPSNLLMHETYEGAAAGVEISATNTVWSSVTGAGPALISTGWALGGGKSVRHTGQKTCRYTIAAPAAQVWLRFGWRPDIAAPSAQSLFAEARVAGVNTADIQHRTGGVLRLRDNLVVVGSDSAALSANTPYDLVWFIDATADTQTLKIFNATTGVQLGSTLSGAYTGGQVADIGCSKFVNTASWDFYIDEPRISQTVEPAPIGTPSVPVVADLIATPSTNRGFLTVELDASASTGGDTWVFSQTAGPAAVIAAGPVVSKRTVTIPAVKADTTATFQVVHSHSILGGTSSDTVVVNVTKHRFWMADPARNVTIALNIRKATGLPPAPGPETFIMAASDQPGAGGQRLSCIALDTALGGAVARPRPVLAGPHYYSGSSFPATFASSAMAQAAADGWSYGLLNVKIGSGEWQAAGTGTWDAYITTFVNSIPAGFTLFLTADHEPENDGQAGGIGDFEWGQTMGPGWCAWQRRIAKVIADLNSPKCRYGFVHMGFTWRTPTRDPAHWDPSPTMPQYVKDATIVAPDDYNNMQAGGGLNFTMDQRFDPVYDYFRARGFTKFAVSEHAFNNDAGATAAQVAAQIDGGLSTFIDANELVYYAYYDSAGPAAGTSPFIDTTQERTAFGGLCVRNHLSAP